MTASEESLGALAGQPIQGEWRLVVRDLASGVVGELESWSLAINYSEEASFAATTDGSGVYSLTNLPAGDYDLRPTKSGHTFLPISASATVSADVQTIDFATGPNAPPVITTPPTNQTLYAGNTARLFAGVSGTGPFHYQWAFNGAAIPNSDSATLVLSNVLVGQSGVYGVVVSNPMPASATASAILTVLPTPLPSDACEGNATNWSAFWPAWEATSASTSDSTEHVKAGASALRFDTGSGFDTGVKFPKNADAHWDLRNVGWLSFWTYAENANPFQDVQPVVVLNCQGGSLTLRPNDTLTQNHAWTFYRLPLAGDATWQRETNGTPSLVDVNQLEIHQDTWGAGFTIWYDALRFEPKPRFDPPTRTNGIIRLTLHTPDGVPCVLMTSTNLATWTPAATNAPVDGLILWEQPVNQPRRFFRAVTP